ncbi:MULTISPECIES: FAD-dependent oxidoreductase [unclassified Streptomyces]|uniref:NAD(P)/FAD-dependent oxidoreductase n=1 Tax=unclassified Streptomyces TaxID=2593676 RepID=UPI002365A36C|nr:MULTISPECIES: FAD-dependent oxidoreductase [unclassified Streptomyces]MDF3141376.1 FAD-dependent oxidoreductase [Streptomyces sp. T21Q-yed]WDF38853.1 FAD-dependent oxidoreductase [Streptomyces sp. T12]
MNRIVVVGASAGGLATAEALRRGRYEGAITLVGDEPYAPYDRPPLSKQLLKGDWQPDRLTLRPAADIDALGLDLRLGATAVGLDRNSRQVRLADGGLVPYDALVVATGVRPRRLPGCDGVSGVHVLRTVEDALALKERLRPDRRLVIVGGGFIGAEVAATARALGIAVTLLEAGTVPMGQAVGDETGRFLTRIHQAHGVDVRTGTSVHEIQSAAGRVTGVLLSDGSVLPADDVLVSIGSLPNTEWLDGSGLALQDGLLCDEYCAAAPDVHGVGDVARWHNPFFGTSMRIEHRTNAAEQAMAVARNILTPDQRRPFAPVPYFWSDQYDVKIHAYGHLRGHDEALVLQADDARRLLVAYRRGELLTGVLAAGLPPKDVRAWRSLVAAGTAWTEAVIGAPAA